MARKKRFRRKDLKKPDEFISLTRRAIEWSGDHVPLLSWVGAGVLIVVLALGVTISFRNARLRDSNVDLAHALAALRGGESAAAASELSQAAERWSSTEAGRVARVLAASSELRSGNIDSALLLMQQAAETPDDLPIYLHQQLQYAWGAALEAKGEWVAAAEKYAAAAQMNGPYQGPALLGEARAREHTGEAQRAQESYRRYVQDFGDFPDSELVRAKIGTSKSPGA